MRTTCSLTTIILALTLATAACSGVGDVPVGGVVAWWRPDGTSLAVPSGFAVCDGSVITTPDSPYHGARTPDLTASVLVRGALSAASIGASGGQASAPTSTAATHTHSFSASSECGNICGSAHKCGGTACSANPMTLPPKAGVDTSAAGTHTHNVVLAPPTVGLLYLMRVLPPSPPPAPPPPYQCPLLPPPVPGGSVSFSDNGYLGSVVHLECPLGYAVAPAGQTAVCSAYGGGTYGWKGAGFAPGFVVKACVARFNATVDFGGVTSAPAGSSLNVLVTVTAAGNATVDASTTVAIYAGSAVLAAESIVYVGHGVTNITGLVLPPEAGPTQLVVTVEDLVVAHHDILLTPGPFNASASVLSAPHLVGRTIVVAIEQPTRVAVNFVDRYGNGLDDLPSPLPNVTAHLYSLTTPYDVVTPPNAFTYSSTPPAALFNTSIPYGALYQLVVSVAHVPIAGSPFGIGTTSECPPGTTTTTDVVTVSVVCSPCAPGSYSDVPNASNCTSCPPLMDSLPGAPSLTACFCDENTWRPSRDAACRPCPFGGECPGGEALPRAREGFYPSLVESELIPCPNPEACLGDGACARGYEARVCSRCAARYFAHEDECKACKVVGALPLVVALAATAVFLIVLFWLLFTRAGDSVSPSSPTTPAAPHTVVWWATRLWRECGIMLAELALLVVLAAIGFAEADEIVVLAIGFLLLSMYLVLHRMLALTHRLSHHAPAGYVALTDAAADVASEPGDDAAGHHAPAGPLSPAHATHHVETIVKLFIVFTQTQTAILAAYNTRLTGTLKRAVAALDVVSFQMTSLACDGLDFTARFAFFLAILPFILAVAWIVASVVISRATSPDIAAAVHSAAGRVSAFVCYFFSYPLAAKALAMFACSPEDVPKPHASYLESAPWIRCGGAVHARLVVMAVVVLGVVLATAVRVAFKVAALRASAAPSALSFLYSGYEPHAWWWEGVVFGRRLGVAFVASVVPPPPRSGATLTAFSAIFLVTLGLISHFRPFHSTIAFWAQTTTLVASLLTAAVVEALTNTGAAATHTALVVLLVGINTATLAFLAVSLVVPFVRLFKQRS